MCPQPRAASWSTGPASGEGRVLHEFDHEVFAVAYPPDGASVAAADRSGTVLLTEAECQQYLRHARDDQPARSESRVAHEANS